MPRRGENPGPVRESGDSIVQNSQRARATPEELRERAAARADRCRHLRALAAEEAERRGGKCEAPGCDVPFQPGTFGDPNPVRWRHERGAKGRPISTLVARAATTDDELRAEMKKCALLCSRHHHLVGAGSRGRGGARKRRLPKAIEPDHLERLLAAPNVRKINGLRTRLVFELMAKCGMRVSEVCNLTFRNLRQSDWRIEIHASKTGDRYLYLPAQLEPLMIIWLDRRARELPRSEWLFPTASGGGLSRGNVADALNRVADRAGVPRTHPHALRHTFATEFIRRGGNVADLQEILGHTTGTMSMRYARSNPERVRRALRPEDF